MKKVIYLCFLIFLCFPRIVVASETNQFITIVNPVRISTYTKDIVENVEVQYSVIQSNELAATWLLTYDSMQNKDLVNVFSSFDSRHQLGVFLEITPSLATESKVEYNDTGFWHHATSVFLSGYLQEERIRLIDTTFSKFKDNFGYYPTSVGAWWIDSYSLTYMQEKYGITANLGVSDQFSTDGYQVWGTYWSTPYYPSKYHTGIPASDEEVKLDLVTIQWAARDPLNGYFNSYYSTQDYLQNPVRQETSYFEELIRLYAGKNNNSFGQIVVGLESDLSPGVYRGEFKNQIEVVKKLSKTEDFKVVTMGEFSNWYRKNFPNLSSPHFIQVDDLIGAPIKVFWYQSPRFRIGLSHNYETLETKIFDFRTYHSDFQEPYYLSPNKEFDLSIYIPSYFDEINNPSDVWRLDVGSLIKEKVNSATLKLEFEKGEIVLKENGITISKENLDIPKILREAKTLSLRQGNNVEITLQDKWIVGRQGYVFRDLTDVATHELARKRNTLILLTFLFILVSLSVVLIFSKLSDRKKLVFLTLLIVPPIIFFQLSYQKNSEDYYVSQAEVDALVYLGSLPDGRVVVVNKECLGCEWHTLIKPAVFANKRSYVKKLGKHPIVYNLSVFESKNQVEAKREFTKLGAKYIYLAKYEDYIERTPFSPGDLGIEKIYDNANAEIWRVKE